MPTYAHIQNGIVTNTILATAQYIASLPNAAEFIDITNLTPRPGRGWTYAEGPGFSPPTEASFAVPDIGEKAGQARRRRQALKMASDPFQSWLAKNLR